MAYNTAKPISAETAAKAPWAFNTNRLGEIKPVYHTVPLDDEHAKLFEEYQFNVARNVEIEALLTSYAIDLAEASETDGNPMIPSGFSARVGFKYKKVSVWAIEGGPSILLRGPKVSKANPAVKWGNKAAPVITAPTKIEAPAMLYNKAGKRK